MTESKETKSNDFQAAAGEKRTGLGRELVDFLKHNKKWWLAPLLVLILTLSLMIAAGSGAAPWIYALF
jgi:hypothetical protein